MTLVSPTVLLVEDTPSEIYIARRIFSRQFPEVDLQVVESGNEALDYLNGRPPFENAKRPKLVFLDLNLPGMSGHSVLEAIKADPALRAIPVVILTNSDDQGDIERAYQANANAYLRKPSDPNVFVELLQRNLQYWLSTITQHHPRSLRG